MTRIVIVGAGIMGLSTAWALVRRGETPLVLDRFGRGHRLGASHGRTRNFNNAYSEEHYLDLLQRAREGWDALGEVDGEPLLRRHGLVTHGSGLGRTGLELVARRLGERGIPASLLADAEAARRWPGMRFDGDVLFSPDAGVARADVAMVELERRVVSGGGEVRWGLAAERIEERDGGATVVLEGGASVDADVVVVTVGAWTTRLLDGIPLPRLRVTEEAPAHFAPRGDAPWPSVNHVVAPGSFPAPVYGMPTPGEGVKVGFHRVGNEVDPDDRPHLVTHAEELRAYVREWMPGLDPESAVHLSCTYTSTDDSAFVLDRVGSIVVGAGFSGQGFKFAPGVGATLADLALGSGRAAAAFRLPGA